MDNYQDKTALIEDAVLSAAAHLIKSSQDKGRIQINSKPDYTIVMNLDLECQKIISDILTSQNTETPVLAEEDENSHKIIGSKQDYFITDPIDGTASCRRYLGTEGGQIGFGPMAGFISKGVVQIAAYFNLPSMTLYTAVRQQGAFAVKFDSINFAGLPAFSARRKLIIDEPQELSRSAVLFYPGSSEELNTILYFRSHGLVENTYRLGGFANDSTRLAEGFEQIQLQTRVKAWDFPAVLIAKEAGLRAVLDPYGKKIDFDDWVLNNENPVLISHPAVTDKLIEAVSKSVVSTASAV